LQLQNFSEKLHSSRTGGLVDISQFLITSIKLNSSSHLWYRKYI